MMPRKDTRSSEADLYPNDADPAVAMMLARGVESKAKNDDEKMHIFWRVFGGAIVSIVALVGLTLYNNLQSGISELRGEITKLNEVRGECVRKDEFNSRISSTHERVSAAQTQNVLHASTLVSMKSEIDAQKEKIAGLLAELKLAREDSLKVKLDVEKNQIADQERKARRDEQYKDVEKAMKDLQAALLECQVKLARLEGQQSKPKETGKE